MKLTLEEFKTTPWIEQYGYVLQVALLEIDYVYYNMSKE